MLEWSLLLTQYAPLLLSGVAVTLGYALAACVIGLVLGLVAGLLRLSSNRVISSVASTYVETVRSLPLLVLLLWVFYALPILFDIRLSAPAAGLLTLSAYASAFFAEILRAGIQSIERGQVDAAKALGMSFEDRMRRVILPQAFRRMIPPLMSQGILTLKNTTILSVITVPDLLYQASYVSTLTFKPLEVYTAVGGIYLLILLPLTAFVKRLERRASAVL